MSVRNYTLDEVLNLIVKRRWLILLPVAVGIAAAPFLARFAPTRYRSDALILVVPQQVPTTYVQSTVVQSVEDRLPGITARILSRARLERIIVDMNLYQAERSRNVMEDVVQTMKNRDIQTSAAAKDINSFSISYVNEDPETARRVTERLAGLYYDQNLSERASQTEQTGNFLTTQLENAKQRLSESEKKLEAYRRAHSGQLPSQLTANLQSQFSAQTQLQQLNEVTNRTMERRLRIEREIAALEAIPLPAASSTADNPSLSTAQQLEVANLRLTALLQRNQPGHPDVKAAERVVAELKARLEDEAPLSATTTAQPSTPAEAALRQKRLDLQAELGIIDRQLSANRTEETRLKKTIGEYQAKVDIVPTRESELVELMRDYSTLSTAYNNLVLKREDAMIAANMERGKIGERFEVIDEASLPEKPFNGFQRMAITASGAVAGLALGLFIIGLLEIRDSSFRSKDEVVKALSLPVLASIPVMTSNRERVSAARRRWAMDVGGSAVLLAAIVVVVVWRLVS